MLVYTSSIYASLTICVCTSSIYASLTICVCTSSIHASLTICVCTSSIHASLTVSLQMKPRLARRPHKPDKAPHCLVLMTSPVQPNIKTLKGFERCSKAKAYFCEYPAFGQGRKIHCYEASRENVWTHCYFKFSFHFRISITQSRCIRKGHVLT